MAAALSGRAAPALVFVVALVLSGVTILAGIQPNDEGLMLQAATRIADGQVPYGDFWWFYPPGQSYLLGGLEWLFGPSLLWWRIVRVLCDAAVAALVVVLARRGGASTGPALGAGLVAALAMAYPSGPHPFPPTLVLALGALIVFPRRPLLAGVLAGACAVFRIEFAAYLVLGILLAYAVRPGVARERLRAALRFVAGGVGAGLVLFGPVVLAAGIEPSFELLVRYPLEDFSDYQSLPFPLSYDGPLNTGSVGGFLSDSAENLLEFYLPLVLVLTLAGAVVALAATARREQWPRLASVVFAGGMLTYLLARTDVFHTAPLAVMVAVLAAWAVSDVRAGGAARARPRALVAAAAAVVALAGVAYAAVEGADRRWLELRADREPLELDRADGVRVRQGSAAALERTVRRVRARVPQGSPIYVATRRADLVTSGYPLLYFLAGRPNPTRYDIQAPGVVTSAPGQREIVADLRRTRPRVVVRYDAAITAAREPNKAGRSTGVRILDAYLARDYRRTARYGPFVILEPRR
ncbi:MAG TPA: hypothetical protein VEX39_08930 [Thermoleophilaceae bacterium]|nr:hypothetical protein [Thermoleophilaceae bacterium]